MIHKHLQFVFTVYHLHKRIIYYFSSEWINQRWLQTINCKRFQSASLTLRRQKMLYSSQVIDILLNIVMNIRLKLLLELNTITRKTHNQFTTINLAFNSEKIQFIIYKCKMKINLHQKFDHLLIIMKLCLCTSFMQFTTHWLWKKMNTEALNTHLKIHFLVNHFLNDKTVINCYERIKIKQDWSLNQFAVHASEYSV